MKDNKKENSYSRWQTSTNYSSNPSKIWWRHLSAFRRSKSKRI